LGCAAFDKKGYDIVIYTILIKPKSLLGSTMEITWIPETFPTTNYVDGECVR
jgi:hypothetical protein